jgi:hypothetical protein
MDLSFPLLLPASVIEGGGTPVVTNGSTPVTIATLDAPDGAEFAFIMRTLSGTNQIAHTPRVGVADGGAVTVTLRVGATYEVRAKEGPSSSERCELVVADNGTWSMQEPLIYIAP